MEFLYVKRTYSLDSDIIANVHQLEIMSSRSVVETIWVYQHFLHQGDPTPWGLGRVSVGRC